MDFIKNKEVLDIITKRLTVRHKEKKKNGEVFTPLELVCEMLDKLPKDVWKDPSLKWLDPANGIGNYPIVVYYKLMKGLEDVKGYENKENRSIHIIENMLFMVELNDDNVKVCREIFKMIDVNAETNIYNADFLVWSSSTKDKYDVIMGNPPYQGLGRKKIYINFVDNILKFNLLNPSKFLLFITPQLILNYLLGITTLQKTQDKFYDIVYFNNGSRIKKYFDKIGSDFCFFLLKNQMYKGQTLFTYNDGIEKNKKLKWKEIGASSNEKFINIKKKIIDESQKNVWDRKASRTETNIDKKVPKENYTTKYPYKLVKKISTNTIEYNWTDKLHINHKNMKILYPSLGNRIIIDEKQNLFPQTSFVLYILCDNISECNFIKFLIKSKLYKFLDIKGLIFGRSPMDYLLKNLIKNKKYKLPENPTDQDIYDYYGITKEEQQLIEFIQ